MTKLNSLSKELDFLINPEPTFEDPENDLNLNTSAHRIYSESTEHNDHIEIPSFSKIRKQNVASLSSINKRYTGKKVSRKDIESEDEEEDVHYDEDDKSLNSEESFSDESFSDDAKEEILDYDDNINSEFITRNDNFNVETNKDDEINIWNDDVDKQLSKATSVRNQIITYDNLLETRIKFQKLLNFSNRLPQDQTYNLIKNSDSVLLKELFNDSIKGLRKLSKVLLEIDAFIDCDEEKEEDGKSKRKLFNFENESLSKRFCSLSDNSRKISDAWYDRTKFVHGNVNLKKFNTFDACPSKTIDHILSDKEKLINRTRVKRSEYQIIGIENDVESDNLNTEIYDDDDFYHQLLKQIIENNIGDSEDSATLTRKYIEIQRQRNKLKKNVDTRASKGRKIRYDVHEKLVNFMAPVDLTTIGDEARNELFKSLFGGLNCKHDN